MKGSNNMDNRRFVALPIVLCSCFCICNSPNATKALTVSMLKLQDNEVSSWTTDSYGVYTLSQISDYGYTDRPGLVEFGMQKMTGPDVQSLQQKLEARVIDYTTDANAEAEFSYMKNTTSWSSNPEYLTGSYTNDVAIGRSGITNGISVCAHFKKFYVELRFTGFADYTTAKSTAISFLQLFEAKINGQ
jgi:hypothetical protein